MTLGSLSSRFARSARHAILPAILAALLLPGSAFAQATRTWVSGVGDDVNPCSRTAPCKTYAGAISKTAAGGEIDALDPGGFGAVTITKSITIVGNNDGTGGGILSSLTNGVIVNGVGIKVYLRNLDIQGAGNGLNGVRILKAKSVHIAHSTIEGTTGHGVVVEPNADARVLIHHSTIRDNADNGVAVAGGNRRVTLNRVDLFGNGCGVVAGPRGFSSSPSSSACGLNSVGATTAVNINLVRSHISDSDFVGVRASSADAHIRMAHNDVTSNATGLLSTADADILSLGDNAVFGNDTDGSMTGIFAPK